MNIFAFLLAGHNIPFLVALGCAVVLAALQIASGFGDHDADLDAAADERQRAVLLKVQGALALPPRVAEQPLASAVALLA